MAAEPAQQPQLDPSANSVRTVRTAALATAAARAAALSATTAVVTHVPPNIGSPDLGSTSLVADANPNPNRTDGHPALDPRPATSYRAGWAALLITTAARMLLGLAGGLLFWSLAPAAVGWHSTVVQTGSMQPRIQPGDVVVARPIPASRLRPGQIVLAADPDHPGRLRLHRIVRFTAAGDLILRGDANRADDSSPVTPGAVRGVGSLRIPRIGTPMLWAREHRIPALIGLAAVLAGLLAAAGLYRPAEQDISSPGAGGPPSVQSGTGRRTHRRRHSRRRSHHALTNAAGAVGVLAALAALTVGHPAAAAAASRYTKTTLDPTSIFTAQPYYTCKAAVLANSPYLYYRMGETSGSTATDSSGNANNGSYQGSGTLAGYAGPCARDNSSAIALNGSTGYISTPNPVSNPTVFTIEIWFKTTTTHGGRLIGFGTAQTGASASYDRHLYLTDTGKLVFGVYPNAVKTIISPASYNDGNWHLAEATLSGTGMALYVDGQPVATDTTTVTAQNYTGYWRIGYDNLAGWGTTTPTSYYYAGTLADAAVYTTALTPTQITNHYTAGR